MENQDKPYLVFIKQHQFHSKIKTKARNIDDDRTENYSYGLIKILQKTIAVVAISTKQYIAVATIEQIHLL